MKRKLLILCLVPMLLFTGCRLFQAQAEAVIREDLGLDISDASVDFYLNTGSDKDVGVTVIKASFDEDTISKQLEEDDSFLPLPFSEDLTNAIDKIDFLKDSSGNYVFPYSENGYYKLDVYLENGMDAPFTVDQAAEISFSLYDAETGEFHYYHVHADNLSAIEDIKSMLGF